MSDDDSKFPSELADRFQVRMPDGLRDRIKAAAEANSRSMNSEIVATLEEKYPRPLADPLNVLLDLTSALIRVIDPEDEAAIADFRSAYEAAEALYGEAGALDRAESIINMLEKLEEKSGRIFTDDDANAIVERAMERRKLTKGAD